MLRTLLGGEQKDLSLEVDAIRYARRSIVSNVLIEKGEVLDEHNLTTKRPGEGLSPVHWDEVIGRRAGQRIAEDTPIEWPMVE